MDNTQLVTTDDDQEKDSSILLAAERPRRLHRKTPKALAGESDELLCKKSPHAENMLKSPQSTAKSRKSSQKSLVEDNRQLLSDGRGFSEGKMSVKRKPKLTDVPVVGSPDSAVVLSPGLLSPTDSSKHIRADRSSVSDGLSQLFDDADVMKFAASVDHPHETGSADVKDTTSKSGRFHLIDTRPDYYPADTPESELVKAFVPSGGENANAGVRGGPRIKHVCRRAAIALGKPLAVFSNGQSLNLSALPSMEKERVLEVKSPR